MQQMHVCVFCGDTGRHGAQFILCVDADENRVHKSCGELLKEHAPQGAKVVRLLHWTELRQEKLEAKRSAEQKRIHDFWAEKFSKAGFVAPQSPKTA